MLQDTADILSDFVSSLLVEALHENHPDAVLVSHHNLDFLLGEIYLQQELDQLL